MFSADVVVLEPHCVCGSRDQEAECNEEQKEEEEEVVEGEEGEAVLGCTGMIVHQWIYSPSWAWVHTDAASQEYESENDHEYRYQRDMVERD